MPSREELAYFGAGPAPLPTPVIEAGSKAFVNYKDTGLGLAEISHRSPAANAVLAEAKSSLSTLYDIPDSYEILFMQAGGSAEFSAVVQNLVSVWVERRRKKAEQELEGDEDKILQRLKKEVSEELKVDYLVTGIWSLKASQEAARLIGAKHVNVAVDARKANKGNFGKIPEESTWSLTPTKKEGGTGSAFVYYCDNETIDGVEFPGLPKCLGMRDGEEEEEDRRLIVADMSSNFLSRRVDVSKYAVIFGGAHKNVGVAGITIAIVKKSLLPPETAAPPPALLHKLEIGGLPGPIVLDYATIAKNNSLYNTLPIFNLWIAGQVMTKLVESFGDRKVSGQEEIANKKAELIYKTLDSHPDVYQVIPHKSVRSRMNICFRAFAGDAEKEKAFLTAGEALNLTGLKGHRAIGGLRISNYNAVPMENVEKLVRYLEDYATQS